LYARYHLSLEKVQTTLSSKELNEKFEEKTFNNGYDLIVKGRTSTCENKSRSSKSSSHNGGNASNVNLTIVRKKVTPKDFVLKDKRRLTTLIGSLYLINYLVLTYHLYLVKQL